MMMGESLAQFEAAATAADAWFAYNVELSKHQAEKADATYAAARTTLLLATLAAWRSASPRC
ncbi:MAG: hypothetical protein U1F06_03425 [Steroidobacteraceae bacterium]